MKDKIIEYQSVVKKQTENDLVLKQLENNEHVVKYLNLKHENELLQEKRYTLYRQIRHEGYDSCSHIWITTYIGRGENEGTITRHYGCIKCGLDTSIVECKNIEFLTENEKIMLDYVKNSHNNNGIITSYSCNFDIAKSICHKILVRHPQIDNGALLKYFDIALENMRQKKLTNERKQNLVRRLNLKPNFNKWGPHDYK